MTQSRWLRRVGLLVALAAVYFIAGRLGLNLAFVNASATPVWPCTGIAFAAFVLLGYDVWPAVIAGSVPVNIAPAGAGKHRRPDVVAEQDEGGEGDAGAGPDRSRAGVHEGEVEPEPAGDEVHGGERDQQPHTSEPARLGHLGLPTL